jgi:hypothetical protein
MRKYLLFTVFLMITGMMSAQVAPDMYYIQFTDKDNGPYTLLQPEQYLSPKALQRRTHHLISVDSYDIPVTPMYVDSMISLGFNIVSVSKWLNGVVVYTTNTSLLSQLSGISFVQGYRSCGAARPSRKLETELCEGTRGVRATDYGYGYTQIALVNGDYLHNLNFMGQGMLISVIDAGFYGVDTIDAFDNLHSSGRVVFTWDVINRQPAVYDYHSHGTMVLSIMASDVPGVLVGTAPQASYALIRTEEGSTENIAEEYFLARGLEIADSIGSDAVNVSLGYTEFDSPAQNHTWADLDGNTAPSSIAARIAASRGMVVVAAAGNSGDDTWTKIAVPADADSILSAGSVNSSGAYSAFSSIGPSADNRVKPDVVAMGQDAWVYSPSGNIFQGSGTSFASPLLCGLATCLWQASPQLKSWEVLQYIRLSADQYYNPDPYRGYGLPDFADALMKVHNASIPDINGEFFFNPWPNPFSNEFYLKIYSTDSQSIGIRVSDISGRIIVSQEAQINGWEINNIRINTDAGLLPGIYIVQVTTTNKRYTSILSKQQ